MENNLYSVADLVDSIINEYQLVIDDNSHTGSEWKCYRQQISRVLKKTGIWDKGIPKVTGKKKVMYFTEQQKQQLLCDKSLYDYVRSYSTSPELRNSKKYNDILQIIKTRRTSRIEYLEAQTHDNDDIPSISEAVFNECKNEMMLKALFEKFFTPIDDNKLLSDLQQVLLFADEMDLQVEDIEAEHRLLNPEGVYYHAKTENHEK